MEIEIEADDQNSSLETVNTSPFLSLWRFFTKVYIQTVVLTEFLILFQQSTEVRLVGEHIDGLNTVGLIVWSVIFGLSLRRMGEKAKLVVDILMAFNEATKHVVRQIIG